MSKLVLSIGIALTLIAPGLTIAARPPRPGAPVLVILPPWADGERLLLQAGGVDVGPFSAPFARLAVAADGETAALSRNLSSAGAWAVADGEFLALLCGASA